MGLVVAGCVGDIISESRIHLLSGETWTANIQSVLAHYLVEGNVGYVLEFAF